MREEAVTKNLLNWLESIGWKIVCFDFPQSGTGILLHKNSTDRTEKNKDGIIPDIIAVKDDRAVYFENKDRFYKPDFDKLFEIKTKQNYSDALNELLEKYSTKQIFYGVGIPTKEKHIGKSLQHQDKINFLVSTDKKGTIEIHYDEERIFS